MVLEVVPSGNLLQKSVWKINMERVNFPMNNGAFP